MTNVSLTCTQLSKPLLIFLGQLFPCLWLVLTTWKQFKMKKGPYTFLFFFSQAQFSQLPGPKMERLRHKSRLKLLQVTSILWLSVLPCLSTTVVTILTFLTLTQYLEQYWYLIFSKRQIESLSLWVNGHDSHEKLI